jgi:hypothetical protein
VRIEKKEEKGVTLSFPKEKKNKQYILAYTVCVCDVPNMYPFSFTTQ